MNHRPPTYKDWLRVVTVKMPHLTKPQAIELSMWSFGIAIVTDLEAHQADIDWYGLRSWLECLFQDLKRGGLNWHLTRMKVPKRVERI